MTFLRPQIATRIHLSRWGLNQPVWKICSSNWVHLPQIEMKIKHIWVATTQFCLFQVDVMYPEPPELLHLPAWCVLSEKIYTYTHQIKSPRWRSIILSSSRGLMYSKPLPIFRNISGKPCVAWPTNWKENHLPTPWEKGHVRNIPPNSSTIFFSAISSHPNFKTKKS